MNPSSTEPPAAVVRVLGENAVHCSLCGGWHHRLYHEPRRPDARDRVGRFVHRMDVQFYSLLAFSAGLILGAVIAR
jgi:hypothetical protein